LRQTTQVENNVFIPILNKAMTNIQEYNPYVAKGKMIESEIQSLSITTFIDLENADTLLKKTQKLKREIEEKRVEIVKPVNDQVKIINSMAKEILIPIEQSELVLKNKILEWNRQQEAIRAEKEKAIKWLEQRPAETKTMYLVRLSNLVRNLNRK